MSRIYRATSSFCAEFRGVKVVIGRGDTIREGHPILVNHPGLFALLVPNFEHEPPKAPPAKEAPKSPPPAAKAKPPATPAPKPPAPAKPVGGG